MNLIDTPVLRQRLALHHQIDRTARLALHDGRSALQRLLDDNAGRQRPLPFHIGAHQACLIERLLHEMNMGIARADQFAVACIGRLAGHQQHRQAAAKQVVHGRCRVGGPDIDMHQYALAASGDDRVARGHVRSSVLVRAAHDVRHRLAAPATMRHLLDDRHVIGAEIAEQILDADLVQAFNQIVGGRELGNVGVACN